jgi:hypothetical protein
MSPPARQQELDPYTLAVIRETAREVVREHVTTCPLAGDVKNLRLDMWGQAGDDVNIGVKAEVKDLQHSRSNLTRGLRAAWLAIVAVIGALAGKLWSS